jgi:hypothetical protein
VLLDARAQSGGLLPAALREGRVAAQARDLAEIGKHPAQEEPQPDALAPALLADPVHPVVPVARADERQAVRRR